jgi:hypothetical protein
MERTKILNEDNGIFGLSVANLSNKMATEKNAKNAKKRQRILL